MSQKAKVASVQASVAVSGEVVRQIRQHARSSPNAEICGVLIGQDRPGKIEIQASIPGANAEEAGAHVTFTQDTWEHIYQVKDRQYPNERIVGWYHSHPGFGVFLSDHDTFIHKNFFASPGQIAWVFDPHSDEEGCFGWVNGAIQRLSQVTVCDQRGGEWVQESGRPEPCPSSSRAGENQIESHSQVQDISLRSLTKVGSTQEEPDSNDSLLRLTTNIFVGLTLLLLGFLICWYFFPRIEIVGVPVDPITGKPLPGYTMEAPQGALTPTSLAPLDPGKGPASESAPPKSGDSKENNGQPK